MAFVAWWACFQCQVLFLRFPVLEEIMRLLPGVYSLWLRLWGSKIGKLTYWAPGTVILDRGFLDIGDDVVFGAGVRLNPHVMEKTPQAVLLLAPIQIGSGALVGGYSLLTAGTVIAENENTRAFLISPPFSVWKHGARIRKTS
jgi:acetyltransferase-like isoleucine patch superfamily enzyme